MSTRLVAGGWDFCAIFDETKELQTYTVVKVDGATPKRYVTKGP